jgi:pimeloyl-ACP methyl ester carboxylesterase
MSKVTCNDVPIQYRCIGTGKDVVLIHGLGANQGFWNPTILLPMARKYRVTVFDLRGHGYSGMPRDGYTSAHMAEDLHCLLEHLSICRAHLIGHSFGGVVALHCATLFPEKVQSIVLADTRVRAFQPTQGPKDWMNSEKIIRRLSDLGFSPPEHETEVGLWLLEKLASAEWRKKRQNLKFTQAFVPFAGWNGSQRAAERWLKLLNSTTARNDMVSIAGLTRERLMSIQQKVLAICCENSTAMRSMEAMKTHMQWCKAHIVPDCGHFFPLTHPRDFLDIVEGFLETVTMERREHPRIAMSLPFDILEDGNLVVTAMTVDVSPRGLLIEGSLQVELGSEVELRADIPGLGQPIHLRGTLVRSATQKASVTPLYGIALAPDGAGQTDWEVFTAVKGLGDLPVLPAGPNSG